jgi:hypothetical protein
MEIPSFQTDNLYKFMALSGLFIFIFSLVYPWSRLCENKLKMAEIQTKIRIINIENEALEDKFKRIKKDEESLHKDVNSAENRIMKDKLSKKEVEILRKNADKVAEKAFLIQHDINKFYIKNEQIRGEIEQLNILSKEQHVAWIFLFVGGFLGALIANIGFYRWYFLVQKPNDLILKNKFESVKLEQRKEPEATMESRSNGEHGK